MRIKVYMYLVNMSKRVTIGPPTTANLNVYHPFGSCTKKQIHTVSTYIILCIMAMLIRPVLTAKVHLLFTLFLRYNSQLRFESLRLNFKLDLNLSCAKDFRNLNFMVTWCIN